MAKDEKGLQPIAEILSAIIKPEHKPFTPIQAFEFLVLTAARSGEVRLATWDEMDLDAGVWAIPAARMKAKRDHRVPLSGRALAILHDVQRLESAFPRRLRNTKPVPSLRTQVSKSVLRHRSHLNCADGLLGSRASSRSRISARNSCPHWRQRAIMVFIQPPLATS